MSVGTEVEEIKVEAPNLEASRMFVQIQDVLGRVISPWVNNEGIDPMLLIFALRYLLHACAKEAIPVGGFGFRNEKDKAVFLEVLACLTKDVRNEFGVEVSAISSSVLGDAPKVRFYRPEYIRGRGYLLPDEVLAELGKSNYTIPELSRILPVQSDGIDWACEPEYAAVVTVKQAACVNNTPMPEQLHPVWCVAFDLSGPYATSGRALLDQARLSDRYKIELYRVPGSVMSVEEEQLEIPL